MTREDAILHLEDIQSKLPETDFLGRCAIDMGIKALKDPKITYCKDCKYYKTPERYSYAEPNLYCCRSALMKMSKDDFCSKGERKEGEAE